MMAAGKIGIASGKGVVGCEKCRIERLRVTDVEAHSQIWNGRVLWLVITSFKEVHPTLKTSPVVEHTAR